MTQTPVRSETVAALHLRPRDQSLPDHRAPDQGAPGHRAPGHDVADRRAPDRPRPPDQWVQSPRAPQECADGGRAADGNRPARTACPLVGRGPETAHLAAVLEEARAGRGGAVFLTGEPGAGRTRLAAEAVALAGDRTATGTGRAGTVGPQVPYRSLAAALHALTRSGLPAGQAGTDRYGRVLARLLSGAPHPAGSPVVVAESVLRLLADAGRRRGVLLVLDDLHDADPGTLAVVEYLLDHLARLPVALLLTARTESAVAQELAPRARQRGVATVLELGPLTAAQVHQLLVRTRASARSEVSDARVRTVMERSGGIPFVVTELLHRPDGEGRDPRAIPAAVAADLRCRVAGLGPDGADFLSVAALFGSRFPLSVPRRALGWDDDRLSAVVRALSAASLIVPDRADPSWYAFRYRLVAEVQLAGLGPLDRAARARQLARALVELGESGEPVPGLWRVRAAELHELGQDPAAAVDLYCREVACALPAGGGDRVPALLGRANRLAANAGSAARGRALESVLEAVAHTARLAPVAALVNSAQSLPDDLSPAHRARLHARLTELALLAGRPDRALAHLELACWSLPGGARGAEAAVVDLAAAQVEPHRLGPTRLRTARELAHRALAGARRAQLPQVACRAALLLSRLTADSEDSAVLIQLAAARSLALAHRLPAEAVLAEARLALVEAERGGEQAGVEQALREAQRLGMPALTQEIGLSLAREEMRRCEFASAGSRLRALETEAQRLGLAGALARIGLARATLLAHRGRRAEMEEVLSGLCPPAESVPGLDPMAYGAARAFCSLLEERRGDADREFARAQVHEAQNPSVEDFGRYGPVLLLGVLEGRLGSGHHSDQQGVHHASTHWNQFFARLAKAVLLGREKQRDEATAQARLALEAAVRYPTARALGLRLVAEEAHLNGWGEPVCWLREAEEHFHGARLAAAAGACRALLRGMGAPVRQRRKGVEHVPPTLRRQGVTAREYEVARLLVERTANKDIAAALHISPRTVEKHVASLLQKTGHPNRTAFAGAVRSQHGPEHGRLPVH
ncbi:AAA family ATPase [Streptomyces sp. XM4193]|uniref:helix-turn-helix transcriptional regulator n=1 Tax=Streptomyces sp. XM4193 TaxID=2929782 RepID=UPI001FF88FAC|nr:LuxR family transcriptional regulator [Streptomyces sp. XM4193]MCK1798036.1 AAA family ATPase [Streptomyces sp. XM4193]